MPLDTADPVLEKALSKEGVGIEKAPEEAGPVYKVLGDSKIPVSKAAGSLWQSRKDQGIAARGTASTCWEEAIRYYDNDQMTHRKSTDNASGNLVGTKQLNNQYTQTENVVFANCSIMVPMLYAKNPTVSVDFEAATNEAFGQCIEALANKLISMKNAPGLSLKPKARRAVLTALLTNNSFVKIGWIDKQDSTDAAITELGKLSEELQKAKTVKQIKEAEGKIKALEEKVNLLSAAGPFTKVLLPDRIVVDPTSSEPDGSDANWMMEWDYLPTAYINAVYATEGDDGQQKSIYEPTHIMSSQATTDIAGHDEAINNFKLVPDQAELTASSYGYKNKVQLDSASYTKVWWVWDKTTRRVFMYADNYWKWPIWVWNDPLKLPRFFPYFRLWFHESVNTNSPKGEVTYYLDQQDAINEINDEVRRGRAWAKRNLFYDKNAISQDDAQAVMSGPDGTVRGVDVREGSKLTDAIMSIIPPSLKFPELFSSDSQFAAINRITGVNDSMRGAQFKTNTTNKAVEAYQQNVDIRVDERVDLIEDFIGDIMWNILMLCLQKWDVEDVQPIVGQLHAQAWKRITDPREFEALFNARVDGGSIAKPNSQVKKQQALQMGQVLGQFASAAPALLIPVIKAMERAFDDTLVLTPEDWQMIEQTMMMALQKAGGGPGDQQQQQQQPPQQQMSGPPASDAQMKEQLQQKIASWPKAAQQKLEELVQGGMPPAEAMKQVEQQLGQAK